MNLSVALRSELVKSKRTSAWYLALIAAVIIPVYAFLLAKQQDKIPELKQDPWNIYLVGEGGVAFNIMILPFFLVFICTWLAQLEYRNNTWKQVYVSPQSLVNVFLSKFLVIHFLLLGVFIINGLFLMVSLLVFHLFVANLNLSEHGLNWKEFFDFYGRIYISLLSISALQFWLGLRLKNFMAPIVIGLCLWLAGMMMLEEYAWPQDNIYPYIYPMRNFYPKVPSDRTTILWASSVYALLFLGLAFIDFKRRGCRV